MMAVSMLTGSMASFISVIGFSEFLAFLPMINLEYTMGLKFFFRGISGVNFKFYDAARWLTFLDLPETADSILSDGFEDAGFDTIAFFLGTADILLIVLISLANYLVLKTLSLVLQPWKWGREKFQSKLKSFQGTIQIQLFLMSYMVVFLCSIQNVYKSNSKTLTEIVQSALSFVFCCVYGFAPPIYFIFTYLKMDEIQNEDKQFHNKFGALYSDMDLSRKLAVYTAPAQLLIRCLFCLNIFFNSDGPLI